MDDKPEVGSNKEIEEVEAIFTEVPNYIRKLERISSQMKALSAQTANMRARSARLAAEHQKDPLTHDAGSSYKVERARAVFGGRWRTSSWRRRSRRQSIGAIG